MKNTSLIAGTLVIVFVSFLSYLFGGSGITGAGGSYYRGPNLATISVEDAACVWNQETRTFVACETVKWDSSKGVASGGSSRKTIGVPGYYSKGFVVGGQNLDNSPKQYDKIYTYCQQVGDAGGFRSLSAYLYPSVGDFVSSDSKSVECNKNKYKVKDVEVSTGFGMYPVGKNSNRAENTGKYFVELGGMPLSCNIEGEWVTNEHVRGAYKTEACHGAKGSFDAFFGGGTQYVIDDPFNFDYRDLGYANTLDPLPETKDGFIIYTRLCDRTGWDDWRSYVRASAAAKENGLEINWEHVTHDYRPNIDFSMKLNCKVVQEDKILEEPSIDIITSLSPDNNKLAEEKKIIIEQYPVQYTKKEYPFFASFWDWLKQIFKKNEP